MSSGHAVGSGLGSGAASLLGSWGTAGGSARSGVLVFVVSWPLVGAALAQGLGPRAAQRVALGTLLGTMVLLGYLLLWPLGARGTGELVQPLWQVLVVQRLQLGVGLGLDRPAAGLLLIGAVSCAWAVRTAAPGRVAWLAGAYAATAVALLGDGLLTRLVGWELLTLAGWALGQRRVGPALTVARVGDATLLLATVLLFWALGGSWSSSRLDARYQLDESPPQAAAGTTNAGPATKTGPTLDLPSLRAQLHRPAVAGVPTLQATLYDKLWLGGRLLTWLGVLFGLAAALKAAAGGLQLLTERQQTVAVRLWLGVAPTLGAGHLLWRLW